MVFLLYCGLPHGFSIDDGFISASERWLAIPILNDAIMRTKMQTGPFRAYCTENMHFILTTEIGTREHYLPFYSCTHMARSISLRVEIFVFLFNSNGH